MKRIYIILLIFASVSSLMAQNTENEYQTQAVSHISNTEISKNSTLNSLDLFYGMFSGLSVLQNTGWDSTPTMHIRGAATFGDKEPLVVIDGFVRTLDDVIPAEIESISVLKDGAATAIWGVRGANGVIVVKTKRGSYNELAVDLDYTYGMGFNMNYPVMADAGTYANALNQALRNDGLPLRYTDEELGYFRDGTKATQYPNVNWADELLRDYSTNHQFSSTFRGGGEKVRYFASLNYQNKMGTINPSYSESNEDYSNQMRKDYLNMRVNLDIDLTSSTRVNINLKGVLKENKQPSFGDINSYFNSLYNTPAAAFPINTESGMWGGSTIWKKNPAAEVAAKGYNKIHSRMLWADMRIDQSLDSFTPGLSASASVTWDNLSAFKEGNTKSYSYEVFTPLISATNPEDLYSQYGLDGKYKFSSSLNSQYMSAGLVGEINYDRWFGKNGVTGALIYRQDGIIPMGRETMRKWQSILFTAAYNFDNRYIVDFVTNYNGASVLSAKDRFKIYPAISAAWLMSNEAFLKDSGLNLLKIRASWGCSGNTDLVII